MYNETQGLVNSTVRFYMKTLLTILLMITSYELYASDSLVYTGIDFVRAEVNDDYKSGDALLVLGLKYSFDNYNSIIFEAGLNEQNQTDGVETRGGLLFRRELGSFGKFKPFLSAGASRVELVKKSCGTRLVQYNSGYAYIYACDTERFISSGTHIEIGYSIKVKKNNNFMLKISNYNGSNDTKLYILSLGATF